MSRSRLRILAVERARAGVSEQGTGNTTPAQARGLVDRVLISFQDHFEVFQENFDKFSQKTLSPCSHFVKLLQITLSDLRKLKS